MRQSLCSRCQRTPASSARLSLASAAAPSPVQRLANHSVRLRERTPTSQKSPARRRGAWRRLERAPAAAQDRAALSGPHAAARAAAQRRALQRAAARAACYAQHRGRCGVRSACRQPRRCAWRLRRQHAACKARMRPFLRMTASRRARRRTAAAPRGLRQRQQPQHSRLRGAEAAVCSAHRMQRSPRVLRQLLCSLPRPCGHRGRNPPRLAAVRCAARRAARRRDRHRAAAERLRLGRRRVRCCGPLLQAAAHGPRSAARRVQQCALKTANRRKEQSALGVVCSSVPLRSPAAAAWEALRASQRCACATTTPPVAPAHSGRRVRLPLGTPS